VLHAVQLPAVLHQLPLLHGAEAEQSLHTPLTQPPVQLFSVLG
jgi:hypothetical protein